MTENEPFHFEAINETNIAGQQKQIAITEVAWESYLIKDAPNGILFETNTLFNSVTAGKGLILVHITPNLKEIIKSKVILASGGCMGASIYVVPLRKDKRLHNLSKFILEYELPKSNSCYENLDIIAIKIPQENFNGLSQIKGIDYLQFGQKNNQIFNEFCQKEAINHSEAIEIQNIAIGQIETAKEFLETCYYYDLKDMSASEFFRMYERSSKHMPSLRYAYFETLQEYLLLHQNDKITQHYKKKGEIYNRNFKKMVFDLCPDMLKCFKVSKFDIPIYKISRYLEQKSHNYEIFDSFSNEIFLDFAKWRLAQTIRHKMMGGRDLPKKMEYHRLSNHIPSLLGHISYRILKCDAYYIYEKLKAKKLWALWNKMNVICPYNSIIPKGEAGLNPANTSISYSIHRARLDNGDKLKICEKLNVKLLPSIVFPEKRSMRGRLS